MFLNLVTKCSTKEQQLCRDERVWREGKLLAKLAVPLNKTDETSQR